MKLTLPSGSGDGSSSSSNASVKEDGGTQQSHL